MKKFLIALLMMAVVLTGVFATDPVGANDKAQLKINAEIKIQYPVYSLRASDWGTYGSGTDASLGVADVMVHSENPLTPQTVVIGDDVLTEHDATITFTIAQTTLSRIKGTYTLSVAATDLEITKIVKSDGTKVNASDDEKTANKFAVSAAPTLVAANVANTTMDVSTAGEVAITYDGKKVADGTDLATFNYTWTHNADNAAGDYEATVTLTITSIS